MQAQAHICCLENGQEMRIDIMVDGGIEVPESHKETEKSWIGFCLSLVGHEIEYSYVSTFIGIAHDVKLV